MVPFGYMINSFIVSLDITVMIIILKGKIYVQKN